ncbi:MAG: ubiquitin-like domain-containing protein [Chloroflexota bacterium]
MKLLNLLFIACLCIAMAWGYYRKTVPTTIRVDEKAYVVRADERRVEALLQQLGLSFRPEDTIDPGLGTMLKSEQSIQVSLARPIDVMMGQDPSSQSQRIYTHLETPQQIYAFLGNPLSTADLVFVNDQSWQPDQALPHVKSTSLIDEGDGLINIDRLRLLAVHLSVHRAIPVTIVDDGNEQPLLTTLATVGQLLQANNITLQEGDRLTPPKETTLLPDMTVQVERAMPISVQVDGRIVVIRTLQKTVGMMLAQAGIVLSGQDYVEPQAATILEPEMNIRVIRVEEVLSVSQERADFETLWLPDEALEIDNQEIRQLGQTGVTKTRTRLRYEDGFEVDRHEEETWLDQESADKIIAYGTRVIIRTLETPDGTIEYWRKIRMLATSYTAATSGKTRDHPAYGITRSGLIAGFGIVAVDPNVVDLLDELYIPGYGPAIAGDTGGGIIGKHVDLGYDEDNLKLWRSWEDVYLLTPAPPWYEIRYVLPQWPQER